MKTLEKWFVANDNGDIIGHDMSKESAEILAKEMQEKEPAENWEALIDDESEENTMTKEILIKALVESKYYTEFGAKEIAEDLGNDFCKEYEIEELDKALSCIKDCYTECTKDEYENYYELSKELDCEQPKGIWLENGNFLAYHYE